MYAIFLLIAARLKCLSVTKAVGIFKPVLAAQEHALTLALNNFVSNVNATFS